MRVCFLNSDRGISLTNKNGSASNFRNVVGSLLGLGHEVVAVSPAEVEPDNTPVKYIRVPEPAVLHELERRRNEGEDRASRRAERERLRTVRALGNVWNNIMVEQTLERVIAEFELDLIIERYSPFGATGALLARRMGVRHILNVHSPLAWEGKQYRAIHLADAADFLESVAFSETGHIVANSRGMRDLLLSDGVPADNVSVVPNGVDVDLFAGDGPKEPVGLDGRTVVGFVASMKAWHGIDELVAIFERLAEDPKYHLLAVGDGPQSKSLRALQERYPGQVTLTGPVPYELVPRYVRAMDIAVAPYPPLERFYFYPVKVLEYMAAGKATVSSAIGDLKDFVRNGETGLLISPGDIDGFVGAIRSLGDEPERRATMGSAAAEETRRSHTWRGWAERIVRTATTQPAAPGATHI